MNIPKLPTIVDEVAVQKALTLILCSSAALSTVPILPQVKLLMEADLLTDSLWTLPRAAFTITEDGWQVNQGATGLVGAGILVEMPEMDNDSPGVSGAPATWMASIVAFEERNTNFLTGTGIGISSSQLCQMVQDSLHLQNIYGIGTFQCVQAAIRQATDWEDRNPGIIAYRTTLRAKVGRVQTVRSEPVTAQFNLGLCTLTCSDNTATIYYTTDGSVPVAANPAAVKYSAPFNVTSGTTVMFGSTKTGLNQSQINGATAP